MEGQFREGGYMIPPLKNCPFCGEKARLTQLDTHTYEISCRSCWVEMNSCDLEKLVENWNMRQPESIELKAVANVLGNPDKPLHDAAYNLVIENDRLRDGYKKIHKLLTNSHLICEEE